MLFRVCVACDHSNPSDSLFCGKCASPLQVRFCRVCREANDANSHFCRSCGTELPETKSPETATPAPLEPAADEARVPATPNRPVPDAAEKPGPKAPSSTILSAFGATQRRAQTGAEDPATAPAKEDLAQIDLILKPDAPRPLVLQGTLTGLSPVVGVPPEVHGFVPKHKARVALVVAGLLIVAAFAIFAPRTPRSSPGSEPDRTVSQPLHSPSAGAVGATTSPRGQAAATSSDTPGGVEGLGTADATSTAAANATTKDEAPRGRVTTATGEAKQGAAEERAAAARRAAGALPPQLPPAMTPRECTEAIATLGLCTPEPKPEGK